MPLSGKRAADNLSSVSVAPFPGTGKTPKTWGFCALLKIWFENCFHRTTAAVNGKCSPAQRRKTVDKMLYVAMTGASQNALAQKAHANNLANISTSGFQRDLEQALSLIHI